MEASLTRQNENETNPALAQYLERFRKDCELRGDVRSDAVDIYYHIDPEELRRSYLAHIPKLGI